MQPFLNHNQGARVLFQSNMTKQAMESNNNNNFSTEIKSLIYAEKDIIHTKFSRYFSGNSGVNINIAMLPLGYNQDDALVRKLSCGLLS